MMFVTGTAVDVSLYVRLLFNIQFADAVENDVDVDIAAFVVAVCVRADEDL